MKIEHDKLSFIRNFSSRIDTQNEHIFVNNDGALCKLSMIPDENGAISQVNTEVLFGLNRNVLSVCGNYNFHLILMDNGKVFAWGSNCYCQCGQDDTSVIHEQPVQIIELENIIQISSGVYHGVALDNNGNVWRWGEIRDAQSFQKNEDSSHNKPYLLKELIDIIWINCGQEHFYALDKQGYLWGYGSNYYKQLGDIYPICVDYPVIVYEDFQHVMSVHTCCFEAYGITKDNKLIRWIFKNNSCNDQGSVSCMTPVIENVLEGVIALTTTESNCVVLLDNGELWSWGDNYGAVLGQNTPYDVTVKDFFLPQRIDNLPPFPFAVKISSFAGFALYNDGEIWGWGSHVGSSTPIELSPNFNHESRTPILPRTAYKDYYVAFLDILGFKEMILNRQPELSLVVKSRMDFLNQSINFLKQKYESNIMIMSDSIVITIERDKECALIKFLFCIAKTNGLLNGAIIRGGISFGELFHEENIVFGPSFITAYQLQEYEAVSPRIIINPDDIRKISTLSKLNHEIMKEYFILDDDKKIFFDYLSFLRDYPFEESILEYAFNSLTQAIDLNFFGAVNSSKKVADKYKWLLKYIFIWALYNPLVYRTRSFYKYGIIHFSNNENLTNLQDCLIEIYFRLVVKFEDYILLTWNDDFPSSTSKNNDVSELIKKTKSNLSENIELTGVKPHDFHNRFSLKTYNCRYEKRPILEVSHFTCLKADGIELNKGSFYKWVMIQDVEVDKRRLLDDLFNEFETF